MVFAQRLLEGRAIRIPGEMLHVDAGCCGHLISLVTTQPARQKDDKKKYKRPEEPRKPEYDILSDGTAPNRNESRFRKDMNILSL